MRSASLARLGVVALCVGAVGCPAVPAIPTVALRPAAPAATTSATPDAGEQRQPSAVTLEPSLATAWEAWQHGDRAGALRQFRSDVTALEALPRPLDPRRAQWRRASGVPATSVTGQDGDAWRAIATDKAVFFLDGHGVPAGYAAGAVTSFPRFVPGTSLVIVEQGSLAIYDASTATRVLTADSLGEPTISPSGRFVAFMTDTSGTEPVTLLLWSTATRTERRFPLAQSELVSFGPIRFAPDESAVVTPIQNEASHDLFAIFELASGGRVDVSRVLMPGFSPDGKLLAMAIPVVGDHGFAGTTTLLDRATGRRIASTGACSYPNSTQFSRSGKLLLVGDLRRVCVFEVPSLRLLAKSPEIRPRAGPDDDLQDVPLLEIAGNDAGFVASTADGSTGLFRLPTAALLWKGRGELLVGKDHRRYVYDASGGTRELMGFDDRLALSSRIVSEAEAESGTLPELGPVFPGATVDPEARSLEASVCSVGPWVFPKEACVP